MNWSIVSLGISFIWVVGGIVYFAWGRYLVKYAKKDLALSNKMHKASIELQESSKNIKTISDKTYKEGIKFYRSATHYWRQAKEMIAASKKIRREVTKLKFLSDDISEKMPHK